MADAFPQIGGDHSDTLTIRGCDARGSVPHVFSHVRKTFQVLLLRLESPVDVDRPPDALPGDWMDDKQATEQDEEQVVKKLSKKRKIILAEKQGDEEDHLRLKWVLEPNVAQEKYVAQPPLSN